MTDYRQLLACSDAELARVDPLVMNLLVAKSVPSLADLDIPRYERLADHWAEDVRRRLPGAEKVFRRTPRDWKNDVNFFRLGVLCGYLEHEAGIAYNEDQRYATAVYYTDPSDLFLNGVMDTRRGTCGNMAALHVAIGRRLGWPVSLACVRSHYICRYDDGAVTHNIEATQAGYGGFKSDPDADLIERFELPPKAISSGSDLRAVTPRELLGIFVGFRGRHMRDTGRWDEAERDYFLARHLFPSNRKLYLDAMGVAVERSVRLFEPGELGSPQSLADWLNTQYRMPRASMREQPKEFPFQERGLHGFGVSLRGATVMVSTLTLERSRVKRRVQGGDGLSLGIGTLAGADPLGFAAGDANIYRYVGNNPTDFTDPSGLMDEPVQGMTPAYNRPGSQPTSPQPPSSGSTTPAIVLPTGPGGLPPGWTIDPTHRYPNGTRYRYPGGDYLDWHPGQPGKPGWGGKDHWHHVRVHGLNDICHRI